MDEGFTVKVTYDVNQARHFLENTNEDDKLLILEDPLGAVEVKNEAQNIIKGIYDLLNLVTDTKRLIVTSRKDILLSVFKKNHFLGVE